MNDETTIAGEQDTFEFEDGVAGSEAETAGQFVVGGEVGPRDEHTPGVTPFEQGGLGVGTDDEGLDDLRSGDDGAAAPSFDATIDEQFAQCLTDLAAGRAHPAARVGARLGRERADLRAGQRERRPVTLVRDPRRLQLSEGPGGGDGGERLVEGAGHLAGRQ